MSPSEDDIIMSKLADEKWIHKAHHVLGHGPPEEITKTLKICGSIMGCKDMDVYERSDQFLRTGHPEKAIEILFHNIGTDGITDLLILKYYLNKYLFFVEAKDV